MAHIDEPGSIEICLYKEGEPLTGIALYPGPRYVAGHEWAYSLYPLEGKGLFSVRVVFDGQLAPHWWGVRVMVFDGYGAPVGNMRPALFYTLPWTVPTVIWFPHRWDGDGGPYVVTMRIDAGPLRAEHPNAAADAGVCGAVDDAGETLCTLPAGHTGGHGDRPNPVAPYTLLW